MQKNRQSINLVDFIVLILGLLPLIIYAIEPYLVGHLSLVWLIGIGLFMYACIGFPVGAILYFYWRIKQSHAK